MSYCCGLSMKCPPKTNPRQCLTPCCLCDCGGPWALEEVSPNRGKCATEVFGGILPFDLFAGCHTTACCILTSPPLCQDRHLWNCKQNKSSLLCQEFDLSNARFTHTTSLARFCLSLASGILKSVCRFTRRDWNTGPLGYRIYFCFVLAKPLLTQSTVQKGSRSEKDCSNLAFPDSGHHRLPHFWGILLSAAPSAGCLLHAYRLRQKLSPLERRPVVFAHGGMAILPYNSVIAVFWL